MSEIKRLTTLLELERYGTIGAVAAATAYSTSGISQQLAQLERDVGVPLLEAAGRNVRFTAAGHIVAQYARRLLGEWESMQSAALGGSEVVSGSLSLATFQTAYLAWIPALMNKVAHGFRDLKLSITQAEPDVAAPGLVARKFDIAILERYENTKRYDIADLSESVLCKERMLLAAPDDLVPGTQLNDLADKPWVFEKEGSPAREWAEWVCRHAGFEPRVVFETSDVVVQTHLVKSGMAFALVPELLPVSLRFDVNLVDLPHALEREIVFATRAGFAEHPAVRTVKNILKGLAESSPSRTDAHGSISQVD